MKQQLEVVANEREREREREVLGLFVKINELGASAVRFREPVLTSHQCINYCLFAYY
jgi:hypothetical protein